MAGVKGMGTPQAIPKPVGTPAPLPQIDLPQAQAPAPSDQEVDPVDALLAQYNPNVQDAAPEVDPVDALLAQYNPNIPDPVEDSQAGFFERARIGFASNDEDKKLNLEEKYGKDGVRKSKSGEFEVKDADTGKWSKFNNDWFGMGDPANLGRIAAFGAGAGVGEVMTGAAMGGEAMTGVGLPATIPTFLAGQAVSGAMGEATARAAAGAMGLKRHETSVAEQLANDGMSLVEQGLGNAVGASAMNALPGMKAGLQSVASKALQRVGIVEKKTAEQEAEQAFKLMYEKASAPLLAQTQASLDKMGAARTISDSLAPEKSVKLGLDEAVDLMDKSKKTGIDLTAADMFPNDVKAQELAKNAASTDKYQSFISKRAEQAVQAVQNFGKLFKPGKETAESAVEAASTVDRAHGKTIGKFRQDVIKNSESPTFELNLDEPELTQQMSIDNFDWQYGVLKEMPTTMGPIKGGGRAESAARAKTGGVPGMQKSFFDQRTTNLMNTEGQQMGASAGKVKTVSAQKLSEALQGNEEKSGLLKMFRFGGENGMTPPKNIAELSSDMNAKPKDVAVMVNRLNKLNEKIINKEGRMTPRELDEAYRQLSLVADAHAPNPGERSSPFFRAVVELKNAYRDAFDDGAGVLLGKEQKGAFLAEKARFSEVKNANENISRLLSSENPGMPQIIAYLKKGGINDGGIIKSLKITLKDNPEAIESLGKAYTDSLFDNAKFQGANAQRVGGYDWNKIQSQIKSSKVASTQLKELIGEERFANLNAMVDVMAAAQRQDKDFAVKDGMIVKMISGIKKIATLDPKGVADILSADRSATKILSSDLAQKMIEKMPPKERKIMQMISNQTREKFLVPAVKSVPGQMAVDKMNE